MQDYFVFVREGDGIHTARRERIRGDQTTSAALWYPNEMFLHALVPQVGEAGLVILKGTELFELLFDATAPFQCEFQVAAHLLYRHCAVGMEELDQARNGLAHRFG